MNRLYYFVGKHLPDICALVASAVVLVEGVRLAWNSDPVWLNRAGALIIIIGVLLASSRFHEWIIQQLAGEIEKNYETFIQFALAVYEKEAGAPLSEQKRADFLSTLKKEGMKEQLKDELVKRASSRIEPDKRRLKLWEIYLVIGVTFLSGFGDYIVSLLKGNGT